MIESQYRNIKNDITVFHNKNEIPCISVPHLHSQYEIYYNISGAKGFMVNGELYKCSKHNLIFIPKIQTHKVIVKKNTGYERCIININEYIFDLIKLVCPNKDIFSWISERKTPAFVNLSENEHELFLSLIKKYNSYENEENSIMVFSVFLEILNFAGILFKNPMQTEKISDANISHVDKILTIAEIHFKTATVSEIASKIYMNEDYVTRIFKEETGLTLSNYLIMRKIAEAKKFLYLGKSVKEACFLSGFKNYANFIRTFKKYEGYPPGEMDGLTKPI